MKFSITITRGAITAAGMDKLKRYLRAEDAFVDRAEESDGWSYWYDESIGRYYLTTTCRYPDGDPLGAAFEHALMAVAKSGGPEQRNPR